MKNILSIFLILLLLAGVLAACNGREAEPPALESTLPGEATETAPENAPQGEATETGSENAAQGYTRLTQWDYHPSYRFLLASVEEQDDSLLLRGIVARDVLTPEEVEAARAEGAIEINGEMFIHTAVDTPGFMANDRLYSAGTGTEIYLVTAFFGEFEGDDPMYRMVKDDEQMHRTHSRHFFKRTGVYREVEVEKTTPVEIWRLVVEPMEWGDLELFAPMEASAHVFFDDTEYDIPDGFPFGGSFGLAFENGKCIHLSWNS
ncbi:MAG: hypothetical protein FWE19_06700 [Oscillospiraceae bacterium]|nr:hypothetical protein [Oscillospiraceae bacterium]